jgi:1-acyl-sn-glycerol-3-phosphate acyltransferase
VNITKALLIFFVALLSVVSALIFLAVGLVLLPLVMIILAIIRIRVRGLVKQLNTDFMHAVFIWIILSNFPLNNLIKLLKFLKRIVVIGKPPLRENKILVVSNHPAWLDQAAILQFIFSYLEWLKKPSSFPFIGVARDSIVRLPFLKALENFYFITPIERYKLKESAPIEQKMEEILRGDGNLVISGPAGRDFKAKKDEVIYSPLKKKPLRKFGGLCGRLATIEGVKTVPVYIEGTERLFEPAKNGGEMKFSIRNLFVSFLLRGEFQIVIIFGGPLMFEGWPRKEARKKIEESVLKLADIC